MSPLVRHWRSSGIRVVVYLDDGIMAVKGKTAAETVSKKVQSDLAAAGFVVNAKSLIGYHQGQSPG